MKGFVDIELKKEKNSKTVIKNLLVKPPLLIQKAMYPDASNPNTAHLYIMSSAGGILQGDKLQIKIKALENSNAIITTQSATKIYNTENHIPSQTIDIQVEKNSYLEFLPKQIIPHKYAEFYQKVNLKVDQSSTLIYSETISCGRIAHGEEFDFKSLVFRTQAINEKDQVLFSDAMNIEPHNRKQVFENLYGKKKIFSTLYIISKQFDNEKLDTKINSLLKKSQIIGGISQLPNNSGAIVRMLSDSIDEIEKTILNITNIVKLEKSGIIKVKN